jgi:hypothetical protein
VPSAVQELRFPEEGVPRTGVTKVGELLSTKFVVPVEVVTPVPPLATANVPANVIAPLVAVDGVKPVVPAEKVKTGVPAAELANNLTVPAEFLKYNFSSTMLIASSPETKFPDVGIAAAVVL